MNSNTIGFCPDSRLYHVRVLSKRFHLNGNTIGFCPWSQKLECQLMGLSLKLEDVSHEQLVGGELSIKTSQGLAGLSKVASCR